MNDFIDIPAKSINMNRFSASFGTSAGGDILDLSHETTLPSSLKELLGEWRGGCSLENFHWIPGFQNTTDLLSMQIARNWDREAAKQFIDKGFKIAVVFAILNGLVYFFMELNK